MCKKMLLYYVDLTSDCFFPSDSIRTKSNELARLGLDQANAFFKWLDISSFPKRFLQDQSKSIK